MSRSGSIIKACPENGNIEMLLSFKKIPQSTTN
jgi:hypothetical protein